MQSIKDYCNVLNWNVSELSRQAGISWQAAQHAYKGELVQPRTKRDICNALSRHLDRVVPVNEIDWEGKEIWSNK